MKTQPRLVGVYSLGSFNVRVYADPTGSNGGIALNPDDDGAARMTVGVNCDRWADVLKLILHEAFEFVMTMRRQRFAPAPGSSDVADFLFVMDHPEFSHACDDVGWFLNACQRDVFRVWRKARHGKR